MRDVSRRVIPVLAFLSLIVLATCGKDSPTKSSPSEPVPVYIRITITPSSVSLNSVGQSMPLTARVFDQNNTVLGSATVSWSSSDAGVATVSSQGVVTAVSNGTATITASSGFALATAAVTVMLSADRIVLEPSSVTLMSFGETVRLSATVQDANGQAVEDAAISWSSSDAGVATVNGHGLVTAVANGSATITARSGSASASLIITVMDMSHDREALIALYHSTDGPNWKVSTNWLTNAPLDSWHGVETNANGQVTSLILRQNNLAGPIPVEFRQLQNLRVLSLEYNSLIGPIPPDLGQLQYLTDLDLYGNQLSGSIPPDIGQLQNLTSLNLGYNSLMGPTPREFGQLQNLTYLFLGFNNLTGPIPQEFGQLRNLITLIIGSNQLTGAIPQELGLLQNVTFLDLGKNQLTGPIPREFGQLHNLTVLYLHNNSLTGPIPPELGQLTKLTSLGLNVNPGLTGPLPESFLNLNLKYFSINKSSLCLPSTTAFRRWLDSIPERGHSSFCPDPERDPLVALYERTGGENWTVSTNWLSAESVAEWHGVTTDEDGRVTELSLAENNLIGSLPGSLSDLARLKALNLSSNTNLSGPLPLTFMSLDMEELLLEGTQLCAPSVAEFQAWLDGIQHKTGANCVDTRRDFYTLAVLYESTNGPDWTNQSNWLSGEALDTWHGVTTNEQGEVTGLDLRENELAGPIPPELARLSNLERLDLGWNQLTGPIPFELVQLSNLSYLYLGWNRLTGDFPIELVQLDNLTYLHLGYNRLTGNIPPDLGQLGSLTELNLADNRLTGTIPPELGRLEMLESLKLYYNELEGAIPSELGSLSKLRLLNLGGSQLTGTIPPELGQLGNLRALSLRRNKLTGIIPPELGQLGKMDAWLNLSENELMGPIPPELGQLGDLRELNLGGNQLSGPIPAELGQIDNLKVLRLQFNRLTGNIPPSLGNIASLKTLAVYGNAEMTGVLPWTLVGLNLEDLLLGSTKLCAPPELEFQDWLRTIPNLRASARCNLDTGESTVYLTQATQSLEYPVPLVAGDDALLRVFVTTDADEGATMPPIRATFYQGDAEVHALDIPEGTADVPRGIDEGDLSTSANARVPGSVLMPGLEMVIEIDPDDLSIPATGITRRLPPTGRTTVDVRHVPPLELTLVPFLWMETPDNRRVLMETEGLSAESDLFRSTRDLLPVGDFVLNVHDPVWTSTEPVLSNGNALLRETTALRVMDGVSGQQHHYYMGTLNSGGGQAAGIGSTVSVSALDGFVIAHELGHNMNLFHAPCGGAAGPDPDYPFEDGSIGAWGYDGLQERLVDPFTSDLMSYCDPSWIGEYHFKRAMAYRLSQAQSPPLAAAYAPAARSLLLWGGVEGSGELVLDPAFVVDAAPVLPQSDGPYRIVGEDQAGRILFRLSFNMVEVVDGEGGIFVFVLPGRIDWPGRLARITLSGPEGFTTLGDEDDRSAALLLDSATGRMQGLLRDWPDQGVSTAAARRTVPDPGLEVVISRGVPSAADWER